MQNTKILQYDFKNTNFYKNKKFVSIIKKLSDEEINLLIDNSVIEFISTLSIDTINLIFRNAPVLLQNKLWKNDLIQKVLILKTKDNNIPKDIIRHLENLNKVIKSQSIKKQIYENKYFIDAIIYTESLENRFFHSYDINKVFNSVVSSEAFNSLNKNAQFDIIRKLNLFTNELLLPKNFRIKYNNIERLLFEAKSKYISDEIIKELNDDELFFLNYTSSSKENNIALKNYLMKNIQSGKTLEEIFDDLNKKEDEISKRIRHNYNKEYYYNRISFNEKIYHILLNEIDDEIIKEKLLRYLLIKMISQTNIDPDLLYNTLKRNLYNNLLTYEDIRRLISAGNIENKEIRLTFYIKFNIALGSVYYLNGISTEQISKLNVKHINKIVKKLEDKTQDEILSIYALAIKMYFIFGYERSIEILSGKYGEYKKVFLDNVAKCNVENIKMIQEGKKYLPDIDKRFINFMFETPNNNHFINMLKDKTTYLYKKWYYLYNNFDDILEKCHNEITLKKVNAILEAEKYDIDRKLITPDNYILNNNSFLENIILGNKTHSSNTDILKEIVNVYTQMRQRIESSIPYVKANLSNGYKYEMMKFDDIQIFELGYKANCCIRIFDLAHKHLLHAALCRNGRVLILYDKLGDPVAFCPLKRNGNVLIVNSIETIDKRINITGNYITECFMSAIEDIVKTSKQSSEPINLVCIGSASVLKPSTSYPFPSNYPLPTIYEKNDKIYSNTDQYHKKLDVIYTDENFDYKNIETKDPNVSYMDPREEVKYVDLITQREETQNVIKVINSINYSIDKDNYKSYYHYGIKEVYYSKDWYIALTYDGIIGEYLKIDYRAKEEFDYYMQILENNNQMTLKR